MLTVAVTNPEPVVVGWFNNEFVDILSAMGLLNMFSQSVSEHVSFSIASCAITADILIIGIICIITAINVAVVIIILLTSKIVHHLWLTKTPMDP